MTYRLYKGDHVNANAREANASFFLDTPREDTANSVAKSCALVFKKPITIIRRKIEKTAFGTRQTDERYATYRYRKLMHEEQAYKEGE